MTSTIKMSQFAQANLANHSNYLAGVNSLSGGANIIASLPLSWTTATRPLVPSPGLLGWNSTISSLEYWNGSAWVTVAPSGSGTVTQVNTGTGLTGGPITSTGTISFASIAAASLWANITGGVAVPSVVTTSQLLDASISSTQGTIIYRNATTWVGLAPGTNGFYLKTQGAAADPIWATLASSGTVSVGTQNQLAWYAANGNTVSGLATGNDGALVTDGSGVPSISSTLPSAVQGNITHLGAQSAALNMNAHQINNVTDPTNPQDAVTLAYITTQLGGYLPLVGGTMAGIINMGNHKITSLTDPSAAQDAVTLSYLNTSLGSYLPLSGGTMSGVINMGSNKITNLLDPTNPQDAATKNYVDTVATGLTVQPACYAATTIALTATYANGASGIGATLTNSGALAQFTTDGTTPATNARILVWNQASTLENGIYTLTNQGSGAVNWVLTRSTDYDQPAEIQPGDLVVINNGTAYAGTSFIETASVAAIGTDAILFSQFTFSATSVLLKANNLSDVANTVTSFNNISPLTTKGDLLTYNSGNVRLGVGSDGQLLQATSGAATGLAYTTATYPATTTVNQILYSSSTNVIAGITSVAGGVLVTDGSAIPQFLTNPSVTGQMLQSVNGVTPAWSSTTWPATSTSGRMLYSTGTNVIGELSTTPSAVLGSTSGGVPGWLALTDGQFIIGSTAGQPAAASLSAGAGITITPGSNSISIAATGVGSTVTITDDTSTNAVMYPTWVTAATGNLPLKVSSTKITFNPSTATLTTTTFAGALSGNATTATTATNATNTAITDDTTTNATMYPTWVTANTGNLPQKVSSTKLSFNPSTTTLTLPGILKAINSINDANGNVVLNMTAAGSAVNYLQVGNAATGNKPALAAIGSDSDIGLLLSSKGAGSILLTNASVTLATFDTTASAVNYISFTNNATGLPPVINALGSDTNIDLNIGGKGTGAVNLLGASTNSSAVAGYVGEVLSSVIAFASAVSLTSTVQKNVTTLTLTPGDWDLWGNVFVSTPSGSSFVAAGIGTTTATLPDPSLYVSTQQATAVYLNHGKTVPGFNVKISSNTTYYLVVQCTFNSTATACGGIYARRRR